MTSKEGEKSTQFPRLLARPAKAFKQAGILYMVFGAQAVLLHGQPRFTGDIDIMLGIEPAEAARVLKLVRKLKLKILVDDPESFFRKTFVLGDVIAST